MKEKVKAVALGRSSAAIETFYFAILLSLALFAPLIGVQWITGPLVNASLFLATALTGVQGAVLIALMPSVLALSVGLLPAVMAPMVPFIMTGNVILVITFNYFKNKKMPVGVFMASVLKFVFLYASSFVVAGLFMKSEFALKAANMMGWPQLLTALAGGIIAFCVLKVIKKI
ncbi:MAG: iron hydrogenase [Patescibacteria group bacterium]